VIRSPFQDRHAHRYQTRQNQALCAAHGWRPRPDPPPDSVVCATDAGPSLRALPEMTINEVSRYLEGTAKALDDVRYILQEAMQAAHEAPAAPRPVTRQRRS